MVEGITYRKQTGIAGGSIPDITFLLPGGRDLHMDVKFPVDNYLRHLEADHRPRPGRRRPRPSCEDVRNRVKELSGRDYINADDTLDEVLLFIPNESVWAFIHEQDPQLIDIAMGQKVVLCSPVSLFAVLAVIRQAVDQTRLARTSDEILAVPQRLPAAVDEVRRCRRHRREAVRAGPEEPRRPHRHPPPGARAPAGAHRRPARGRGACAEPAPGAGRRRGRGAAPGHRRHPALGCRRGWLIPALDPTAG